jgi:hypothetical protein
LKKPSKAFSRRSARSASGRITTEGYRTANQSGSSHSAMRRSSGSLAPAAFSHLVLHFGSARRTQATRSAFVGEGARAKISSNSD